MVRSSQLGEIIVDAPTVTCLSCSRPLEADVPRSPCPDCGSTLRCFTELVEDRLKAYTGTVVRIRSPLAGKRRYRLEAKSLPVWSHRLQRLVHRSITVDRLGDRYVERIVDLLTSEVIHSCDEPLHQHIGHGSARAQRRIG